MLFDNGNVYSLLITNDQIDIIHDDIIFWTKDNEMKELIKGFNQELINWKFIRLYTWTQTYYMFKYRKLLIFGLNHIFLYDSDSKVIMKKYETNHFHPVSLLTDDENSIEGYVIQPDVYHDTSINHIIYDLVTNDNDNSFPFIQPITENKTDDDNVWSKYYYIQITDNPNKLLLVHPSRYEKSNEETFLLHRLPFGYSEKSTRKLYLFDSLIGCVYIIHPMPPSLRKLFNYQSNIELTRTNIPFEKWFSCSDKFPFSYHFGNRYPPNRCEKSLKSNLEDQNTTMSSSDQKHLSDEHAYQIIRYTLIATFIILSLIVVLGPDYLKNKRTNNINDDLNMFQQQPQHKKVKVEQSASTSTSTSGQSTTKVKSVKSISLTQSNNKKPNSKLSSSQVSKKKTKSNLSKK